MSLLEIISRDSVLFITDFWITIKFFTKFFSIIIAVMPPFTREILRMPSWWFPFSVYGIVGFFTIEGWTSEGLPWLCDLQKSNGCIRMAYWQGEWCIMEGYEYDQSLIDRWCDFMILFHQ